MTIMSGMPYAENPNGRVTLRVVKDGQHDEFRCHSAVLVSGGVIAVVIYRDQYPIWINACAWDIADVQLTAELDTGASDDGTVE